MSKLDENTIIQFNLKWFIGIIFSLITAFSGFYYVIQKPNNDTIKIHMDEIMLRERDYQNLRFEKLDDMSQKISDLEGKIDALSKRNDDLNSLRNRIDNTGATLGN